MRLKDASSDAPGARNTCADIHSVKSLGRIPRLSVHVHSGRQSRPVPYSQVRGRGEADVLETKTIPFPSMCYCKGTYRSLSKPDSPLDVQYERRAGCSCSDMYGVHPYLEVESPLLPVRASNRY